jgi:hypothetical protein
MRLLRLSLGKTNSRRGGRVRGIATDQVPLAVLAILTHRGCSGAALRIKEWTVTTRQRPHYLGAAMLTPLDDLDAFYLEHGRWGELHTRIKGGHVWMTCSCGAGLSRSLARPARLQPSCGSGSWGLLGRPVSDMGD